jgi:hypothetical protein
LHEAQVKKEIADPDEAAFHGATRHGHQTGWEAQLVRIVTGRTPDQPDDPEGSRDAVEKYQEKEALPKNKRGKIRYAKTDSVGAFLCPEVQSWALSMAETKAKPLMAYSWAETKTKTATTWVEYDYVEVCFEGNLKLTGVSFVRDKHKAKPPEAQAIQAIDDFIKQKRVSKSGQPRTWEQEKNILGIMENVGVAAPYTRLGAREEYPLRFPSMKDLLEYLGVEAHWMKSVLVVFRKVSSGWTVHTMYAVNCTQFPVPPKCTPAVKTGKWTGNLRKEEGGAITFLDPATLL